MLLQLRLTTVVAGVVVVAFLGAACSTARTSDRALPTADSTVVVGASVPTVSEVPSTPVPPTKLPSTTVLLKTGPLKTGPLKTVPLKTGPLTTVPLTTTPTTPAPTAPPTTLAPAYVGAVREIDPELAAAMTPWSFREGCPVGLDELRLVEVTYRNYAGESAAGRVIVHRDHADGIAQVFQELFDAGFPMRSVDLVDVYEGSDQSSMQANNTSAFNCREVAYRNGVWSNHAFGTAIDINPLVNPYVRGDFVDPEVGRPYADRSIEPSAGDPGMIFPDDVVVQAFARIGWSWGGNWGNAKDYQHFSASGS